MNSKKKCVDYEKIMARKVEKEEMKISLISKRREAVYDVVKKKYLIFLFFLLFLLVVPFFICKFVYV